jgi:hypothetical protein
VVIFFHARLRVHWAPGIPRALYWAKEQANPGRMLSRECGRMFASAAKQSTLSCLQRHGLLRFARNDGLAV